LICRGRRNSLVKIDIEESCRFAYEKNNSATFISKSITEITSTELLPFFNSDIKVLVGCAPCQPFSSHTFKYNASKTHKDKDLLSEFSRLIKELTPHIISMENVPAITKQPIFTQFLANLEDEGYKTSYTFVFCPQYGIPQNRRRLVLLASRLGEIHLIPPTHTPDKYITVRDTISSLPSLRNGEIDSKDPLY